MVRFQRPGRMPATYRIMEGLLDGSLRPLVELAQNTGCNPVLDRAATRRTPWRNRTPVTLGKNQLPRHSVNGACDNSLERKGNELPVGFSL